MGGPQATSTELNGKLGLVLDNKVGRELQQPMQMDPQFLEIHVPVESVADVVPIEGVVGPSVVDCLINVVANADAQFTPAVSDVDHPPVLERALPLRWTRSACFLQSDHSCPPFRLFGSDAQRPASMVLQNDIVALRITAQPHSR